MEITEEVLMQDLHLKATTIEDIRKTTGVQFLTLRQLYSIQNRTGFGYTFSQEADYSGDRTNPDNWKVTEREHEFSFHTKLGRPSEGWRLKTYIEFYDNIDGTYGDGTGRRFFDGAGVEIGKEMGYYEWSVAYMREYSITTRDYEWKAALQFTLLTFPDKRLFGIGAKGGSAEGEQTKPDVHVFSGIKIEDEID